MLIIDTMNPDNQIQLIYSYLKLRENLRLFNHIISPLSLVDIWNWKEISQFASISSTSCLLCQYEVLLVTHNCIDQQIFSFSLFAELCQSCQTLSAGLLVKQFLELHLSLQRVRVVFDSLLATVPETKPSSHTTLQCLVEDACKVPTRKNAIFWVQAALGTTLSKFNLFGTQEKIEGGNGEKCHYVVIENSREEMNAEEYSAQNKQTRLTQANFVPNSTGKRLSSSKRNLLVAKNKHTEKQKDQSKESELKVAASLAEKLLVASCEWFLKYLEESLGNEFGLKNEGSTEVACLLGQLKKVNHWLDNLVVGGESGDKVDHRVESLRKSLYRFLLEHVNSAVASS